MVNVRGGASHLSVGWGMLERLREDFKKTRLCYASNLKMTWV